MRSEERESGSRAGLPDGFFSNQKSQFGNNFEDLGMQNVGIHILWPFGIFDSDMVYLTAVWCILWSFGIFFTFLVCCTKKNLATLIQTPLTIRRKQSKADDWNHLPRLGNDKIAAFDNFQDTNDTAPI
jgi:hypothetical protein